MSRVWEKSEHVGSNLLMLLAIADFADDDGNAYPAVATLARKCRTSQRNANLILARLKSSGELAIRLNEGPKGVNRYQIQFPRPEVSYISEESFVPNEASGPPEACFPKPLKRTSDKPSLNRQEPTERVVPFPKGTRLPENWELPVEYNQWAIRELGWNATWTGRVAERFADYWRAASGQAAIKADWFAVWRNWCRREKEPQDDRHPPRRTQYQQNQAAIANSIFGHQGNRLYKQPVEKEILGEVVN
jgi:hypothetical protein